MSISKITALVFGVYFITGTVFVGTAHLVSAGSKYSSSQQKVVTVPIVFKPVQFVLYKLF